MGGNTYVDEQKNVFFSAIFLCFSRHEKICSVRHVRKESLSLVRIPLFVCIHFLLVRVPPNRFDVLFMTEPLDELTVQAIGEFKGKTLTDLGKENVDLGEDEEDKAKQNDLAEETQGESALLR